MDDSMQDLIFANPGTGQLIFRMFDFTESTFDSLQRLDYYSCIWVKKGEGTCKFNFSEREFRSGQLIFFSPNEPFCLRSAKELSGTCIGFHPDFLLLETRKLDISWNRILFNDINRIPTLNVEDRNSVLMDDLIRKMKMEIQQSEMAQHDALLSYLRIFLITCSRLKICETPDQPFIEQKKDNLEVLQNLKKLIEANYKLTRGPVDYAKMLNMNQKSLGNITKRYFNKSITELVQERILVEAKRELFLTDKSIKEIADELGFEDVYYFSRFFKNLACMSPRFFRAKFALAGN